MCRVEERAGHKRSQSGKETFHIADFKNSSREYLDQKFCDWIFFFLFRWDYVMVKVHYGVTVLADAN